jgi:integrase
VKFTELSIKKLKLPESGRKIFFDDSLPGFGLRVATKTKSFVVLYGKGEGRRYKTIGRYPDLSLADARREAKAQMVNGSDVRGSARFPDVVDAFLAGCENHNRPSTIRSYRHYLKAYRSRKRVQDVKRGDIQDHLEQYKEKPSGYSHALTAFKIFFNWCLRKEKVDRNPVAGERSVAIPSRERTLLPEEIRAIWAYDFRHFSTILKLCLITGQRRSEIAAIDSDWIVGDVLTIPVEIAKNKRRHSIPVTERTLQFLGHARLWRKWCLERLVEW